MASFPPVPEQLALLTHGTTELHTQTELQARLEESRSSGRPLRVKVGFDPTRPDLHLGHSVVMAKMRQFQDLGHEVVLVIGELTATIGDPTGRNTARPPLTRDEVRAAAQTYAEQAFRVLDRERTELRSNSEWLERLSPGELIELMSRTTLARMLERDDFAARIADHRPLHLHELLYPLLQAYDSVALRCDVEIGGTDQLFNMMLGRDLMPSYGLRPQLVITMPLLEGTDAKLVDGVVVGKKMSKSLDNYIGLTEPPGVMFRKVMQLDDDVVFRYFELLSHRSTDEIAALRRDRLAGRDPREIKALFGRELVERFHDAAEAAEAAAEFEQVYHHSALPADVPEIRISAGGAAMWIGKVLSAAKLARSSNEAIHLVKQGSVSIDDISIRDEHHQLERGKRYLVRIGSKHRRFAYVEIE